MALRGVMADPQRRSYTTGGSTSTTALVYAQAPPNLSFNIATVNRLAATADWGSQQSPSNQRPLHPPSAVPQMSNSFVTPTTNRTAPTAPMIAVARQDLQYGTHDNHQTPYPSQLVRKPSPDRSNAMQAPSPHPATIVRQSAPATLPPDVLDREHSSSLSDVAISPALEEHDILLSTDVDTEANEDWEETSHESPNGHKRKRDYNGERPKDNNNQPHQKVSAASGRTSTGMSNVDKVSPSVQNRKKPRLDANATSQASERQTDAENVSVAIVPRSTTKRTKRAPTRFDDSFENFSLDPGSAVKQTGSNPPRPKDILLGYWKDSDGATPEGKHAVYGIIKNMHGGQLRARVVKYTRDNTPYIGNFRQSWISLEETVLEPPLADLVVSELIEYVRLRQAAVAKGPETKEEKLQAETRAIAEAKAIIRSRSNEQRIDIIARDARRAQAKLNQRQRQKHDETRGGDGQERRKDIDSAMDSSLTESDLPSMDHRTNPDKNLHARQRVRRSIGGSDQDTSIQPAVEQHDRDTYEQDSSSRSSSPMFPGLVRPTSASCIQTPERRTEVFALERNNLNSLEMTPPLQAFAVGSISHLGSQVDDSSTAARDQDNRIDAAASTQTPKQCNQSQHTSATATATGRANKPVYGSNGNKLADQMISMVDSIRKDQTERRRRARSMTDRHSREDSVILGENETISMDGDTTDARRRSKIVKLPIKQATLLAESVSPTVTLPIAEAQALADAVLCNASALEVPLIQEPVRPAISDEGRTSSPLDFVEPETVSTGCGLASDLNTASTTSDFAVVEPNKLHGSPESVQQPSQLSSVTFEGREYKLKTSEPWKGCYVIGSFKTLQNVSFACWDILRPQIVKPVVSIRDGCFEVGGARGEKMRRATHTTVQINGSTYEHLIELVKLTEGPVGLPATSSSPRPLSVTFQGEVYEHKSSKPWKGCYVRNTFEDMEEMSFVRWSVLSPLDPGVMICMDGSWYEVVGNRREVLRTTSRSIFCIEGCDYEHIIEYFKLG